MRGPARKNSACPSSPAAVATAWVLSCNMHRTSAAPNPQALAARRRRIKALLSQRRLPEQGWDDATIEMLLQVKTFAPCSSISGPGQSFVAGSGQVADQVAGTPR